MLNEDQINEMAIVIAKMEGVEAHGKFLGVLDGIFASVVDSTPDEQTERDTFLTMLQMVSEIADQNEKELQKLPEGQRHFGFQGEMAAHGSFFEILKEAYALPVDKETRKAFVSAKVKVAQKEIDDLVAQPLAEWRALQELENSSEGRTLH